MILRVAVRSADIIRRRTLRSVAVVSRPAVTVVGKQQHTLHGGCRAGMTSTTACHKSRCRVVVAAGLPFSLSRPQRPLKFKWGRRLTLYTAEDLQVEVDALAEGRPKHMTAEMVEELLQQLEEDAQSAVPLALKAKQQVQPQYSMPAIANLSLVLCDDPHIQQLNKQHRGKDSPTDVLSFEIPDESLGMPLPVKLLGDLVISLDTAQHQADERG